MDSFTTQKTKPRKTKRLAKKSRVLDTVSQAIETIVVLVTVAKLCYQLVVTFQDSGVAAVILANRNLAFAVGNAIVIALIAKSGILSNQEAVPKYKGNDLYEEFVRESSRREGVPRSEIRNRGKQSEAENEAKQSITETRPKQSEAEKETHSITENVAKQSISDHDVIEKKTRKSISEKRVKRSKPQKLTEQSTSVKKVEQQSIVEHQEITVKKIEKHSLVDERQQIQSYQRSKSENMEGSNKSYCGRLRRSETDASSERFDSDDELRCKIESFIAKQRRNQIDD
ncbi:Nucleolar-like protein [Hirschfeldia incana]|nr:Nucleolar-like protein [Hirschfeldia incana]